MENRTSFGLDAASYRRFRPRYPRELFGFLAGACDAHDCALDCATGNGQAAVPLAEHFERVWAFDVSPAQIQHALRHERIEYFIAEAECLPEHIGPLDLVTIAQGAHWFDLPRFYAGLQRLLRPHAVIAIWGYSYCRIAPEIDTAIRSTVVDPIAAYWSDGNRIITEKYARIEFPFTAIEAPEFALREQWDRETLFGHIRTWSAYKRCVTEGGLDPLVALAAALDRGRLWPPEALREVVFDLHLRVGRA